MQSAHQPHIRFRYTDAHSGNSSSIIFCILGFKYMHLRHHLAIQSTTRTASSVVFVSMQSLLSRHATVADLCSVSVPGKNLPPILSGTGSVHNQAIFWVMFVSQWAQLIIRPTGKKQGALPAFTSGRSVALVAGVLVIRRLVLEAFAPKKVLKLE